ncbi:hypothetical protein Vretimale_6519 [Volvox reticuliferus]|uniref:Serine protease n=1 Tax=Volvox reticuliferus TaxID=1737510 RepID=A0A8J4G7Z7_9CHLO|nr:hypothetical protein Vretimale_6519 [Volvox reticuliferus]
MENYNWLRANMGFDVDYELGRSLSSAVETKRKKIYDRCRRYVLKVLCEKDDGELMGFFNGFLYCGTAPLLLTTGHIVGGATKYFASFYDGEELQAKCEMTLLRFGGEAQSGDTATKEPDVAVFRVEGNIPSFPPPPFGASTTVGDTAYIIGYKGREDPQLTLSEGLVSYVGLSDILTTVFADKGYSGCPVFNSYGFVIGMVKGCDGNTIKQVSFGGGCPDIAMLAVAEWIPRI